MQTFCFMCLFQIMLQYNVPNYRNSLEFLTTLAKKRGFLQKGGIPNTELAATTFLNDWTGLVWVYSLYIILKSLFLSKSNQQSLPKHYVVCYRAKLSYHSRAPERQDLPSYLSDAIVTELQSGLNMDMVREGNQNAIRGTSVHWTNQNITPDILWSKISMKCTCPQVCGPQI